MTNQSPTPAFIHLAETTFAEAIPALLDGKRITRKAWGSAEVVAIKDGYLKILQAGQWHELILHENDFTATDWIVVDQEEVAQ